jgi:hypothetical protein
VVEKKARAACDGRTFKANSKDLPVDYKAIAAKSQLADFQTAHLVRRFRISPPVAAIVAMHAFSTGARR